LGRFAGGRAKCFVRFSAASSLCNAFDAAVSGQSRGNDGRAASKSMDADSL